MQRKMPGFDLSFTHLTVTSAEHLKTVLNDLAILALRDGVRPILHFNMHGSQDKGLYIAQSDEYLSWEDLYISLRRINEATRNNLVVVSAACYSLHSIRQITLEAAVPFFALLAPDETVQFGFLEDNLRKFYDDFISTGSIDTAYQTHLSDRFRYFHCEEMLCRTIAKYIVKSCKGRSAQERKERLLTLAVSNGLGTTPQNLRHARTKIKEVMQPSQELLDRYSNTFLIGRPCSISMDDIQRVLDGGNP